MALFAKLHLGQSWGDQWPERVLAQNEQAIIKIYKPMGEIDFCEMDLHEDGDMSYLTCSSCGVIGVYLCCKDGTPRRIPKFCPECGRRVRGVE